MQEGTKASGWLLAVWLIVGWMVLTERAGAADLPSKAQREAYQSQQDCSVFVAVRREAKERLDGLATNLKEAQELARERKAALESCGAAQGLTLRSLEDRALIENCDEPFRDWLSACEKYDLLQIEIAEQMKDLKKLNGLIGYQCGLAHVQSTIQ